VDQTLRQVFDRINERPRTDIIQSRIDDMLSENDAAIKTMTGSVTKLERELEDYKKEVLKIIRGESAFTQFYGEHARQTETCC